MALVYDSLLVALGLVILLLAGDMLVRGAVNLSLRLGIPALIVSLTVVAFGTSAPELVISIAAIKEGAPGIALGNVVGSNIANVLLVLGIPALIAVLATSHYDTRRTWGLMMGATVLFMGICFSGTITRVDGLLLLAGLGIVLYDAFRSTRLATGGLADPDDLEGAEPGMPGWRIATYLALGLVGLPLGAHILIDSSVDIARALGLSETVIGLTLIAIGTSLPELATTVMAAIRRQADVALGNVIGSNIFNLLAIIGIASLVGPIQVDRSFLEKDLWVMLGASLLLIPFVLFRRDITRGWGIAMLVLYILYLQSLI